MINIGSGITEPLYEPHHEKKKQQLFKVFTYAETKIYAIQHCSKFTADQWLCFSLNSRTILLLLMSEISNFLPSSVIVQAGLCQNWPETGRSGFLMWLLIMTKAMIMLKVLIFMLATINSDN